MSGKGKGKSKRKDKIKFKDEEIVYLDKCIDLKRFAYDVIKYTALKFHVPESCIAVWEGRRNDYGRDDFISLVCIPILDTQIDCRHQYHVIFSQHYEKNKLAESKLVSGLLCEVIDKETSELAMFPLDIVNKSLALDIVNISLAIACELVLFLYSKDMDLYPKRLVTTWFQCCFILNNNKKRFVEVGGLQKMLEAGLRVKRDVAFQNKFIEDHCLPYHTSAKNPDLRKLFSYLVFRSQKPKLPRKKRRNTGETSEQLENLSEIADTLTGIEIKPPAPDGATGFNPPENTGGPLEPVSQFRDSLEASFQDLSVRSPEEQPWHHRPLSTEERRKLLKVKSPYEQAIRQLALESSGTKWSRDQKPSVSKATGTTQSYEDQGARPKVRVQNTGASGLQTGESSSRSSVKQSLGQLSSDSSETE